MKKIILILCIIICLGLVARCNKHCSDKIYASCMEAGKQSQETCYKYAYQQ